jgi:nucleoside-diphosphate-sugar epimerase
MNIVLIGHEGYLGRGLHLYLSRQNHKVFGWDRKENLFNINAEYLARNNIDLLINMSLALDRAGKTFQVGSPSDEVNVMGARHLVKVLKGSEITWIQMSTREVLGPVYKREDVYDTAGGFRGKFLVNEDCPYNPQNSYGKSKIMAEFISETHPFSNVIRLTTCYTDYNDPVTGSWVVKLLRSIGEGKPVKLTQGGLQFRDPLHIDDLGRLMVLLREKKVCLEKIHAGGGEKNLISLLEFCKTANPQIQVETAPGGDFGFAFDISRAARLTGWEPQILVREKIPVAYENIKRGVVAPAPASA